MDFILRLVGVVLGTIVTGFIISVVLSFLTAFSGAGHVCKTYSYYLPVTYVMCKLTDERK